MSLSSHHTSACQFPMSKNSILYTFPYFFSLQKIVDYKQRTNWNKNRLFSRSEVRFRDIRLSLPKKFGSVATLECGESLVSN